jgi:putative ABC transport system permease protein
MKHLLKIAWRNLFRNRRRTAASLITVAFGAAGLLVFQGFNTGIMNQYRDNTIRGYYGYGQIFSKDYYGRVFEKPWEHWIDNPTETEKNLKKIPGVKELFPRLSFYSFLVKGGINLAGKGEGIIPERENQFFDKMNFEEGGNLQSEDEVILGKGLAKSLDAKVGDTVTLLTQTIHGQINGIDVRVAGIFHMGIKAIDDQYFRLHLKSAQQLLNTEKIELFSVETLGVEHWDELQKQVEQSLPGLQPVRFEILDKVYYQNSVDFLEAQFAFVRSIILLIVGLGIFNTVAVGLLERGGEIGALRANGERVSRLWRILLFENAFMGVIGGVLGLLLAVLVNKTLLANGIPMPPGPGITRHYRVFLDMTFWHYLSAMLLPVITCMVAAIFPIRKLLTQRIPELLRSH